MNVEPVTLAETPPHAATVSTISAGAGSQWFNILGATAREISVNQPMHDAAPTDDTDGMRRWAGIVWGAFELIGLTFIRGLIVGPQIVLHAIVHPRSPARVRGWLVRDW